MPRIPLESPPSAAFGANDGKSKKGSTHIGFILLHDYSMIAFANAVETLRMANYISRRPLYRWTVVNPDQTTAVASNGLALTSIGDLADLAECDMVFVCGGVNIRSVTNDAVLGTGQMDIVSILRAAKKTGVKWYFLEDESPTSEQQIPQSLRYLESLRW